MQTNIPDFDAAFKLYLELIKKLSDDTKDADDKLLDRTIPSEKDTFSFKIGRKFISVFMHDQHFQVNYSLVDKSTGQIFRQVGKEKVLYGSIFDLKQYVLDLSGPPRHFCY